MLMQRIIQEDNKCKLHFFFQDQLDFQLTINKNVFEKYNGPLPKPLFKSTAEEATKEHIFWGLVAFYAQDPIFVSISSRAESTAEFAPYFIQTVAEHVFCNTKSLLAKDLEVNEFSKTYRDVCKLIHEMSLVDSNGITDNCHYRDPHDRTLEKLQLFIEQAA